MFIDRIPADDIRLNDVIGEGQVVWAIVKDLSKEEIDFYWGDGTASLWMRPQMNKVTFHQDDLVNVIRRR